MGMIIGMSFPRNDKNLGLEPSILNVLPRGSNVEYCYDNHDFDDSAVEMYLCSVYISGMAEFKKWAMRHDTRKIVVGGYHPTMFPEAFLNYADKIVIGPTDDIYATLKRKSTPFRLSRYDASKIGNDRFVGGHLISGDEWTDYTNNLVPLESVVENRIFEGALTFSNLPRYDLYDIGRNQQIIPGKKPDDLVTSVNTSFGCPFKCDFCCTPVMFGPRLISKPLEALSREVDFMKAHLIHSALLSPASVLRDRYVFVRDENFTLQNDFEERLRIIARLDAKIYMFGSANTLTKKVMDKLKEYGVYMICIGLEDPTKTYAKNKTLDKVVAGLKDRGIYTYLSFIVNPLEVVGAVKATAFYKALKERVYHLMPEMICGNFLMPFPGTPIWDDYYHLISEDDFKEYDSKTPFLIKNRVVHDKMRYYMFKFQWDYFMSSKYDQQVRDFEVEDTLHLRFLELKRYFDEVYRSIAIVRP